MELLLLLEKMILVNAMSLVGRALAQLIKRNFLSNADKRKNGCASARKNSTDKRQNSAGRKRKSVSLRKSDADKKRKNVDKKKKLG
jgi:hypothetical protein